MTLTRKLFAVASALAIACGGSTVADNGGGGGGGGEGGTGGADGSAANDGASTTDGTTRGEGGGGAIACGQTSCTPDTQDCCVTNQGGATCGAKGSCKGSSLSCSSAASCQSGQVCCGAFVREGGTPTFNASCASSCPPGQGSAQLCATNAECPPGEECRQAIGGLKTCRRSFDGGFGFDAGFGGG